MHVLLKVHKYFLQRKFSVGVVSIWWTIHSPLEGTKKVDCLPQSQGCQFLKGPNSQTKILRKPNRSQTLAQDAKKNQFFWLIFPFFSCQENHYINKTGNFQPKTNPLTDLMFWFIKSTKKKKKKKKKKGGGGGGGKSTMTGTSALVVRGSFITRTRTKFPRKEHLESLNLIKIHAK